LAYSGGFLSDLVVAAGAATVPYGGDEGDHGGMPISIQPTTSPVCSTMVLWTGSAAMSFHSTENQIRLANEND
jgi:hypothetical protein